MKFFLADKILNPKGESIIEFKLEQKRILFISPIVGAKNSMVLDKENLKFKLNFSIERQHSCLFEAQKFLAEHSLFLNQESSCDLKMIFEHPISEKQKIFVLQDACANVIKCELNDTTSKFSYEFISSKIKEENE